MLGHWPCEQFLLDNKPYLYVVMSQGRRQEFFQGDLSEAPREGCPAIFQFPGGRGLNPDFSSLQWSIERISRPSLPMPAYAYVELRDIKQERINFCLRSNHKMFFTTCKSSAVRISLQIDINSMTQKLRHHLTVSLSKSLQCALTQAMTQAARTRNFIIFSVFCWLSDLVSRLDWSVRYTTTRMYNWWLQVVCSTFL